MSGPTIPLVKVWDGVSVQAVKAASTPPVAADPAAVVGISPNSLRTENTAAVQGLPVLPVKATAAAPAHTEGALEYVSADLAGNVRVIGSIVATPIKAATSVVTGVAASVTSVVLKAANATRLGLSIVNDVTSTGRLAIRCEAAAATFVSGGYTDQLDPGATWECPFDYTGEIRGIWTTAVGFANIDEFTP